MEADGEDERVHKPNGLRPAQLPGTMRLSRDLRQERQNLVLCDMTRARAPATTAELLNAIRTRIARLDN